MQNDQENTNLEESPLRICGLVVANPFLSLKDKFGFDGGKGVPWGAYDGYQTPAERSGVTTELEYEDLLITVSMNSRIGQLACQSFWRGMQERAEWFQESCRLLSLVPPDLHLADADDQILKHIDHLFWYLDEKVEGIGIAVAGKILAQTASSSVHA